MIQQSNFSVNIRSGLGGPIMPEYDSENSRNTRSIEATTDATICPQIVIHKKFRWYGADGLYVAIRYGSKPYQVEFWVPKPNTSFSDGEDDWSFQIPGKNILDKVTKQLVGYEYHLKDLDIGKCDQLIAENCPNAKGSDSKYLGSVWVSIKRQQVRAGSTPTSSIANYIPVHPPQKMCQHSIAVSRKGVRTTFKRVQIVPFDMGTMISNPNPRALRDIAAGGQWMNSIFIFRPRDQLVKLMNGETKSELPTSQLGPDINVQLPSVNVATSEPSSKTASIAPTAIMQMSEKRRGASLENQIGAEESSSLHDIASHQHKRPRREVTMRSSGSQRDSVASHSSVARPHLVPYDTGNEEDETEDVNEETEREQLLNIFAKAGESKSSDKHPHAATNTSHRPKLPVYLRHSSSNTRSSEPDLSSVLTEEYRKLREASNANRRFKSKTVYTSKSPSTSSNQSADSSTLRVVIPETQFTSREQGIPFEEELNSTDKQDSASKTHSVSKGRGVPSQRDTRSTTMQQPAPATPVPASSDEAAAIRAATPETRIQALRQKKELLQKQLEDKLMAECEELERQINA